CKRFCCSGVAWRQAGPTAAAVMRRKSTLGMILLSTNARILLVSPAWMALSDLIEASTSSDSRLIIASGASSAAAARGATPANPASASQHAVKSAVLVGNSGPRRVPAPGRRLKPCATLGILFSVNSPNARGLAPVHSNLDGVRGPAGAQAEAPLRHPLWARRHRFPGCQ